MRTFLVLLLLLSTSAAHATFFREEVCNDTDVITQEVLQLELSGVRWQSAQSTCLNQKNFKTVLTEKEILMGPRFKRPAYLLPALRHIEVVSSRFDSTLAQMTLSVRFLDKNDQVVNDQIVYQLNYGDKRAEVGCATVVQDLENFVMREDCYQNVEKVSPPKTNRKISSN